MFSTFFTLWALLLTCVQGFLAPDEFLSDVAMKTMWRECVGENLASKFEIQIKEAVRECKSEGIGQANLFQKDGNNIDDRGTGRSILDYRRNRFSRTDRDRNDRKRSDRRDARNWDDRRDRKRDDRFDGRFGDTGGYDRDRKRGDRRDNRFDGRLDGKTFFDDRFDGQDGIRDDRFIDRDNRRDYGFDGGDDRGDGRGRDLIPVHGRDDTFDGYDGRRDRGRDDRRNNRGDDRRDRKRGDRRDRKRGDRNDRRRGSKDDFRRRDGRKDRTRDEHQTQIGDRNDYRDVVRDYDDIDYGHDFRDDRRDNSHESRRNNKRRNDRRDDSFDRRDQQYSNENIDKFGRDFGGKNDGFDRTDRTNYVDNDDRRKDVSRKTDGKDRSSEEDKDRGITYSAPSLGGERPFVHEEILNLGGPLGGNIPDDFKPVYFTLLDQIPFLASGLGGGYARAKRQLDPSAKLSLQELVDGEENLRAHLSNFSCVLDRMNMVDPNGEVRVPSLIDQYNHLDMDPQLKNDLQNGLKDCARMTSCLPEDNADSFLPRHMQQAIFFFRCAQRRRQISCFKKDIRGYLRDTVPAERQGSFNQESTVNRVLYIRMSDTFKNLERILA